MLTLVKKGGATAAPPQISLNLHQTTLEKGLQGFPKFTFGREKGKVDFFIDDVDPATTKSLISRIHAEIDYLDGHYVIQSRGLNGIYVQNIKVDQTTLKDRDKISFGGGPSSLSVGAYHGDLRTNLEYIFTESEEEGSGVLPQQKNPSASSPLLLPPTTATSPNKDLNKTPISPHSPSSPSSSSLLQVPLVMSPKRKKPDSSSTCQTNSKSTLPPASSSSSSSSLTTSAPLPPGKRRKVSLSASNDTKSIGPPSCECLPGMCDCERPLKKAPVSFGDALLDELLPLTPDAKKQIESSKRETEKLKEEFEKKVKEAEESKVKSEEEKAKYQEQANKKDKALNKMKDEFVCIICQEIMVLPQTLSCAHSFCKPCIVQWIQQLKNQRSTVTCPSCRTPVSACIPAPLAFSNTIEILVQDECTEEEIKEWKERKEKAAKEKKDPMKMMTGTQVSTRPAATTIVDDDEEEDEDDEEEEEEEEEDYSDGEPQASWGIEYARSGRATCRHCRRLIANKELRWSKTFQSYDDYHENTHYYHVSCGFRLPPGTQVYGMHNLQPADRNRVGRLLR